MMLSVSMLTEGRFFMSEPGGYQEPPPAGPPPGGYQQPPGGGGQIPGAEKKLVAGILGILLGGLGIHKFYLGYTNTGIIQLVVTFVTCGAAGIIGLIEGIIYLTKTDQDFVNTYIVGKKEWF